jgi:hypothetical protein
VVTSPTRERVHAIVQVPIAKMHVLALRAGIEGNELLDARKR